MRRMREMQDVGQRVPKGGVGACRDLWGCWWPRSRAWRSAVFVLTMLNIGAWLGSCSSSTRPGECPPYNPIGSLDIGPTWSPGADRVAYVHGLRYAGDSTGIYVSGSRGGTAEKIADWTSPFAPELAWS